MDKNILIRIGESIARYSWNGDALWTLDDSMCIDRLIKDYTLSEDDKDVIEVSAYDYIHGYFNATNAKEMHFEEDTELSVSYKNGWNDCIVARILQNDH